MKTRKSFLLRIDPRLYSELEAWAAADLRSVNAQVEFLLKECVRQRRKKLPDSDSIEPDDETGTAEGARADN
jgi:hypothetical protein